MGISEYCGMGPANLRHPGGFRLLLQQTSFPTDYGRKYLPGFYHPEAQTFPQFFRRKRKMKESMEGYYKLIAGCLAQKGLISEIGRILSAPKSKLRAMP